MNILMHNRIIVNVLLSCVISNALRKTKIETDSYKLPYLPEKDIFIDHTFLYSFWFSAYKIVERQVRRISFT
jgi:hypothetical protein